MAKQELRFTAKIEAREAGVVAVAASVARAGAGRFDCAAGARLSGGARTVDHRSAGDFSALGGGGV